MQKGISIFVNLLLCVVCFLQYIAAATTPVVSHITEIIPNNIQSYVDTHPQRKQLIQAIQHYTHSKSKAVEYADLILVQSYYHNIEPSLVAKIIAVESSFRSRVVSSCGAIGLMQVKPNWVLVDGELKWQNTFSRQYRKQLMDPATNLDIGISVLEHYIAKTDTLEDALAAYNGSRGSLKYPLLVMKSLSPLTTQYN